MYSHTQLKSLLRDEVLKARAAYEESRRVFWSLNGTLATETAGSADAADAADAQSAAMVAYTRALVRFNRFLLDGTVPDDLK